VQRRVWAPIGKRPIALGHHRYQWLYVTAFVQPASGETVWYLSNGISKPFFEKLLADFARTLGAGRDRIIILVLDGAGWHTEPNLAVPDGLRLVYLPPYTPELQPAEHLWPLVDEPVANRYFKTLDDLDAVLAERCRFLDNNPELVAAHTNFHWWPKPVIRK
jgi:transposase